MVQRCFLIRFVALLLVLLLSASLFALPALAAPAKRTVRVGYFLMAGYQELDKNGEYSGFGYDYLNELANYTGWNYEYVVASWQECLEMLKAGQIDLLGTMQKNDQRTEEYGFPALPAGNNSACLFIREDDARFAYEDFAAFNGMTVGVMKGNLRAETLQLYCEQNNFSVRAVIYDTQEQLAQALAGGAVDAVLVSELLRLENSRLVAQFSTENYYYVTNKNNTDLLAELNKGLEQLHAQDHFLEQRLYKRHYSDHRSTVLTREEMEYIQTAGPIPVALFGERPTISYYDPKDQTFAGVTVSLLELISERTGLTFTYEYFPEDMRASDYFAQNDATLIAPLFVNDLLQITGPIQLLAPLLESRLVMIGQKGKPVDLTSVFTLAVPHTRFGMEELFRSQYPQVELVMCETPQEAFKLVAQGKADATFENEMLVAYRLQSPYFSNLEVYQSNSFAEDLCLVARENEDPRLISILNKTIHSISEREANQLVVDNTVPFTYLLRVEEWLYAYRLPLLVFILAFGAVVILLFLLLKNRRHTQLATQQKALLEELRQADLSYQQELFRRANFDELTGIYTREYFLQQAQQMLDACPAEGYVLICLDLDRFKLVNDMFGPETGNALLQAIAQSLRTHMPPNGIYGRLYADQFAIFHPLQWFSLETLERYFTLEAQVNGHDIHSTLSIGVYNACEPGLTAEQMLGRAMLALQAAKNQGSQRVSLYNTTMLQNLMNEQSLIAEMLGALESNQFQIYLQPQYDHQRDRLVGAEALVRWQHPVKGLIPPNDFIPAFERNGFICKLDEYVWEEACRVLEFWYHDRNLELPISVNVSRMDIYRRDLGPFLKAMVERHHIPPWLLHLEITETAYMDDPQQLISAVQELHALGFIIEMDDFGSGYSSLNMLKDVPVDTLKLDMRFLSSSNSERGNSILRSIAQMAQGLSLGVIAEGVETIGQADFLKTIGCRVVQGYLYGRPMHIAQFEALLSDFTPDRP